ncbi:hypothetical protein EDC02_3285 [Micromonospora sp. Llam0]|nr:hypothetical protein EDC02_3285 [Micromonospora sp. Llam0]
MRRAISRASRRIATLTLLLFGLTVVVPAGIHRRPRRPGRSRST